MTDLRKELDKTSYQLLLKEPYFGHFFVGLIRQVTDANQGMSVAQHGNFLQLVVSQEYWQKVLQTPALRQGAVKHELLHLTFKHPLRCHAFAHRELFSLAADLVVNQHLKDNELPPGAMTLASFPEFALERERSVDYYYQELMHLYHSCRGTGGDDGGDTPTSKESMLDYLGEGSGERGRHQHWSSFANASSAERALIENGLDTLIYHTVKRLQGRTKQWGSVGGALKEYLESFELFAPPSVDWRRVLRLFATSSQRTYVKTTISRPSRRYGTVPGVKIKRKNKILVALDTSGSVPAQDLKVFFRELHHVWRQGAQVQIVECDTEVTRSYPYRGTPPKFVKGRGGTGFDGPIRYANDTFHPDAIVYFTDGYAPAPQIQSRCPMLWLLSSAGADLKEIESFPGRRIKLRG